jgi:hypothetical protein
MIDINYLKAVSCFDSDKYQSNLKKTIEIKANDNLDYYRNSLCRYYTSSKEILQTIYNTPPWGAKSFRYTIEMTTNNIQRVIIDGEWQEQGFKVLSGEWRRKYFNASVNWGGWVSIDDTINFILNDKSIQELFIKRWDRYKVINEHTRHIEKWEGPIRTMDEIVEQIKKGTAKIYENKLIG